MYVLLVDAAAVAVVALTATLVPIGGRDLVWFAILAGAAMLHLEATRQVERLRELATVGTVYTDLQSIWTFAGLLLLPPPFAAALIGLTYTHMWFRVSMKIVPHRWVFSASNMMLASAAGATVLMAIYPNSYPDLPHGGVGLGAIAGASVARWLVNRSITRTALMLMRPGQTTLRKTFAISNDDMIDFGTFGLGAVVAFLTVYDPMMLPVLAVPVLVVHRGLLMHEVESAARTDPVTGLHNAAFWRDLATKQLARCDEQRASAGLLLVHVDYFDELTERHGPEVGDRVLRRVADTLKSGVRQDNDLVGRLGGNEFSVLLTAVTTPELAIAARRLQHAIAELKIEADNPAGPTPLSVTVSIGGGTYPDSARSLDQLILSAAGALFNAQSFGRAQARFARLGSRDGRTVAIEAPVRLPSARQAAETAKRAVRGDWEIAVLTALAVGPLHTSQLLAEINSVEEAVGRREHKVPLSLRVLAQTLDRMETDGLVLRHDETITHPSVKYELTTAGRALLAGALPALAQWGKNQQRPT